MAAADKLNGAYWRKRAIELAEKQKREDDDLCLRFHREYERILHELDKEISIFYARYAANESVSMADARRLLRDAELEDFRMSLDEFRDKALAGGFDKELEEVYLRSRISRLQALQTQVELRMMELFGSQRDVLRDHLQERCTDTYYRTVYAVSQQMDVASTFARIDPQTVEKILATPWAGSEFSSRIWADKDKLTRELMQTLSRGFVRGDSLDRMTKEFTQRMGVSESRAAVLIHTESAHIAAEASVKGYRETGVKEYRFLASLQLKTCSICGMLDGKVFKFSERETGVNFPPMHPQCHCTYTGVTEFNIGDKRAARDPVTGKSGTVPKSMTWEEWHKKYVEDDPAGALADKKYKRRHSDKAQFDRYIERLGKTKVPKSLDAFQNLKYTEPEKWKTLQQDYKDQPLRDKIQSDAQPKKIESGKQGKHIKGHNNYIEGRSYLTISEKDAQALVDRYAGTGELKRDGNGQWKRQEVIHTEQNIGVVVDLLTGKEYPATDFKIHYSKKGTHIVPFRKGQ